jgi:hypothetical protein
MKKNLLLIIASIISMNLLAQTEFMPIGATVRAQFIPPYGWTRANRISIFNAQKDTLVDSIVFRKVQYFIMDTLLQKNIGFSTLLFKQKHDSIFAYEPRDKTLNFLFKNKYSVGDSLKLKTTNGNKVDTFATLYVDSVVASNGINRYACRFLCNNQPFITQRFVRFNLYDKFIPDFNWYLGSICQIAISDVLFLHYPLCYTDKTTTYQTPLNKEGRCYPFSPPVEIDYSIKIFPNPADSYISVLTNSEQSVRLSIRNLHGIEIFRTTLLAPKNLEINHLPNGFYIVSVENEKGSLTTQKLIVHH